MKMKKQIRVTKRDPMTLRLEEAEVVEGDYLAQSEQIAALEARIRVLEQQIEMQQPTMLAVLNALQQFSTLKGMVDAQALQMLDGMDRLAQVVGVHDFARQIGITHSRRTS